MRVSPSSALLAALVVLIGATGYVAPSEDPLAGLVGSLGGSTAVGGRETTGPISIRDSIVGDIISISVNTRTTVRTNVSIELLQMLVCALNEHGNYGIEMTDVLASGDPVTITGNTIGDLVNVNVNVTANIQNEINQDYTNIWALLLSSTGDVDLFRKLSSALEQSAQSPSSPSGSVATKETPSQNQPGKKEVDVEQALKKLFPNLASKQ
uniref:Uncharacterized protein n=1 Tax=Anopheles albimanus TaxID=7167 RepID=A0A182F6K3_ANOAL